MVRNRIKRRIQLDSYYLTEGRVRPGLDPSAAADLLWTMTSLRLWEDLVLARGWSPGQYQEHMTRCLLDILIGDPRDPR